MIVIRVEPTFDHAWYARASANPYHSEAIHKSRGAAIETALKLLEELQEKYTTNHKG